MDVFDKEEQDAATRSRMKVHDLARTRGWLRAQLVREDRILALVDLLSASFSGDAWARHGVHLRAVVEEQLGVEERVLDPVIDALGLRAHVVAAQACRQRIRRDLQALSSLGWQDGDGVVQRLRGELEAHFRQEESCSYGQLARQQSDAEGAALTQQCASLLQSGNP